METNSIKYLSLSSKVSMADEWFDIADENHFWMQWRFKYINHYSNYFSKKSHSVLEIGCGSGVVLHQLQNKLEIVADGCDLNELALKKINNIDGAVYLYNIYDRQKEMVNKYETIFLLDVIEHIDNDIDFLKTSLEHLKKGGYIIINVPAFQHLFSKYDRQAGHLRRYNKNDLKIIFDKLGLEIVDIRYWGFLLLPIIYIRKIVLVFVSEEKIIETGFKPPNKFVNQIFKWLMNLEYKFIDKKFPGTSLIVIAKKVK